MKKLSLLVVLITLVCVQSLAQISEAWVSLYSFEEGSSERPTDMAVDASGNIYVCGWTWGSSAEYEFITLKYDPLGELLWSAGPLESSGQPEALCLDESGNVYVIGRSTQNWGDIAIYKFNTNGDLLWEQYYDNTSSDGGYDIGIGANGMIYAVGYSDSDIISLQYNPEGELQWTATYNGSDDGTDIGKSLILDEASNVYVTGFSESVGGVGSNRDITTIKYNADGIEQWVALYDGAGNSADEGYEIALDEQDNVYVLGYSNDENYHPQFTTIKYNSGGNELWVNKYYNPETLNGSPNAITVHDSQNIYVTGGVGLGISIVKINYAGDTAWTRNYNSDYADQTGTDIITNSDGNIYVTGWARDEVGMWTRDYGTLKYSPAGSLLWDIWYAGPGDERDDALKICLDHENNVIITGETHSGPSSYDIGTIKYSQSTSVEELTQSIAFNIYPNPAASFVSLQSAAFSQQSALVEIYDLNGRKLIEKQFRARSEPVEIDVSSLQGGIYFCRLTSENKTTTQKLIIQK